MGMSEPDGPGRKGACLLIPAMPLLAPQLLTSSLPALSNLGTQSADSWWLRVAWEFADPYVRAICEKMKGLEEYPGYGFAVQIDVTVGNALLIEWAARDKKQSTAVRVLHQLITGEVGCKEDFEAVRGRLPKVTGNFRKEIKKAQKTHTPESVQARLSAPFYLSQGTHYPRILTLKQQAKSAPNTLPGELQHPLLPALHAGRAHHEDNSNAVVHLLRVRLQHPAPRRRQHRRRRQRRRGRRSRPCRQWTPMAKL